MRNRNLLKSCVSEIRVQRIRVNKGVDVLEFLNDQRLALLLTELQLTIRNHSSIMSAKKWEGGWVGWPDADVSKKLEKNILGKKTFLCVSRKKSAKVSELFFPTFSHAVLFFENFGLIY